MGGLLNAERLKIYLCEDSSAAEVGGGRITIAQEKKRGRLKAQSIEGEELDLEAVEARVVRGNIVRIGAGCRIGLAEYTQDIEIESGAVVEQQVRV